MQLPIPLPKESFFLIGSGGESYLVLVLWLSPEDEQQGNREKERSAQTTRRIETCVSKARQVLSSSEVRGVGRSN